MNAGRVAYRKYPAPNIMEKAAHIILNNFIVEAVLVSLLGVLYLGMNAVDRIFGTRLRDRKSVV